MAITNEEKSLLKKLASGALDGFVGDDLTTKRGSTVWKAIKNGVPVMFKQGPGGKFFNGKENDHFEGVMHTLEEWATDEQKLEFLRKFGWLMKDEAVKAYSAMFQTKEIVKIKHDSPPPDNLAMQSSIMRLNSSRFFVLVPLILSAA